MSNQFSFEITATDPGVPLARTGVISTPHGQIHSPAFVVVGTHGKPRSMDAEQLSSTGAEAMISNGYHLFRKAAEISDAGGLAEYSGWHHPTITDSGGFQVMSLGSGVGKVVSMDRKDIAISAKQAAPKDRFALVTEEGVEFRHPEDGRIEFFSPETSIQTQVAIGADIMMAFDELTSIGDSYEYNVAALERTRKWAIRSLAERNRLHSGATAKPYQALYGILQGAHYEDLRKRAATDLGAMDFDGYGLGGAFEKEALGQILGWTNRILPEQKPRHLLGLSKPDDIFVGVEHGIDTFDCVAPTREARHGRVYTSDGYYNILRSRYRDDSLPLEPGCDCLTCAADSPTTRAEIRAMLKSHVDVAQLAAFTLISIHNVRFIVRLTELIRAAIAEGRFLEFKREWLGRYMP